MAHRLAQWITRSNQLIRQNTNSILQMDGANVPSRAARVLYKYNTPQDLSVLASGSDADIGGQSSVNLQLDDGALKFSGDMNLTPKPGMEGKIRTGYASFRNKTQSALFSEITHDLTWHDYLALRVRAGGDPRTRNCYYVNVQVLGQVQLGLWQHRLYFQKDNEWEDLFIPLRSFVRVTAGQITASSIPLDKSRIRSFGVSILGGNNNTSGKYALWIDSIRAINEEDLPQQTEKTPTSDAEWDRGIL